MKPLPDKLTLSRAEVAAIIDYVHWHVRATNGTGRRVWERMNDFLNQVDTAAQAETHQNLIATEGEDGQRR